MLSILYQRVQERRAGAISRGFPITNRCTWVFPTKAVRFRSWDAAGTACDRSHSVRWAEARPPGNVGAVNSPAGRGGEGLTEGDRVGRRSAERSLGGRGNWPQLAFSGHPSLCARAQEISQAFPRWPRRLTGHTHRRVVTPAYALRCSCFRSLSPGTVLVLQAPELRERKPAHLTS